MALCKGIAVSVLVCLWAQFALAQTATTRPLKADEEVELKTLSGQLSDPARDAKTKLDAATLLLTKSYPQAAMALRDFLSDSNNRPAQLAVAEAIARNGTEERSFVDPLLAMLTGTEASVRDPAGRALAAYKDGGVAAKLVAIASNAKADRSVRLATIGVLARVLDKPAVDALIKLLDDEDASIKAAAADALAKLTNIRAFGTNAAQWKKWWNEVRGRDRSEWLAGLVDNLSQAKDRLEQENARLRNRLVRTVMDLYAATPVAQRDATVLGFLKDAVEDVRLVGLDLVNRSIESGQQPSAEIRSQVKTMLADSDFHVRAESAKLLAAVGDGTTMTALLDRLNAEMHPAARQGIFVALGLLHDLKAMPAILSEIQTGKDDDVAAAAAMAMSRIAFRQQFDDALRKSAATTLIERLRRTTPSGQSDALLREAILAAMGDVGDKNFVPSLEAALKDDAATVRLAAINSLSQLQSASSAGVIEKLVSDPDRGVRGSALAAMRSLGGDKYLDLMLQRTDSAVEDDATNRKQAWDLVMGILSKADTKLQAQVADKLANRPDAVDQRIKIMQIMVAALAEAKSADLPVALRQLADILVKNSRQAEAAVYLAQAYTAMTAGNDPLADDVWLEWVNALLAADDLGAIKAMAQQESSTQNEKAHAALDARLAELKKKGSWNMVVALTGEVVRLLPKHLTEEQIKGYVDLLAEAKTQQLTADRLRVAKLVGQLTAADEAARKAATGELQTMGDRAVAQLLNELKTLAQADKPNVALEQSIADLLRQIAPKLTGYDPSASRDQKLKLLAAWLPKT